VQQSALQRIRFEPGELESLLVHHETALVRPAAGVAFVPETTSGSGGDNPVVTALVARLRASFDADAVLA
jgi:hypothetical protein